MNLHPSDNASLERTVGELASLLQSRLSCIALHGESASGDYRSEKSPLDLIVVVDAVTPQSLASMRPYLKNWNKRRIGPPLVLDLPYLDTSFDVFPLEFLDIMDRHLLLSGRTDPFAAPTLDPRNLRFEVEEQLRGKMLHLWEGYLAARNTRDLVEFVRTTPPGFARPLRGLLYLRNEPRPIESRQLLRRVERSFAIDLGHFHRLERVRTGEERLSNGHIEAFFAGYLDEVRSLVRQADQL